VPRPCVLCKGGHDAAERVSFDINSLSRSSGSGVVPEFDLNDSSVMRPWYPPLRRMQEWGTLSGDGVSKDH